ncbi:MAG: S9 family peptidase [Steroidobacteraceae bacterium]
MTTAHAAEPAQLTLQRLFDAPDLAGDQLRGARLSADGHWVTYLKGAADDKDRLDLWGYDVRSRQHRRLVDARALQPKGETLSAEEEARRERQRSSAFRGVVDYSLSPDGRAVLLPSGGDLYLQPLAEGAAIQRLTTTEDAETDARFSPRGRYVSYVRAQNLYVLSLETRQEIAITRDGGGTVSFGMAEFIAQEEMDRDTGYWWSPDERRIAFERVDEASIGVTQRFEINAADVKVVEQRYPYAGGANARVELWCADLASPSQPRKMDLGTETDIYLARVTFFPASDALAVQRQSRNQQRLELLRIDAASGAARVLITETSPDWVPLHDDLHFLPQSKRFVWASDRDGFRHLYLYDLDGKLIRQLTRGEQMIVGDSRGAALKSIDEAGGWFYFMSNAAEQTGRALYRDHLDAPGKPQRLTTERGWHSVTFASKAAVFLDSWSTTERPPGLSLHRADGTRLAELAPNRLEAGHPYFAYAGAHAVAEFGTLDAEDGQKLNFQLLKPANLRAGERRPVIVNVYGGPGVQNVVNAWGGTWQLYNQLLVQRGYIVFTLDNRGSGFRGRKFEAANWHRLGTLEVSDQQRGVEYLRSLPFVDGARIGIFGWSYGGYMALLSLLKAPDSFAAGVSGAPVTDWRLYDTHYTERYLGTPQANAAGYEAGDVLRYAADLKRPLLLIHGMADDNVLFTHSTQLMRVLQGARKPFELMTYPGGKHGLIRHADAGPHALQTILDFFQRVLPPVPAPSP